MTVLNTNVKCGVLTLSDTVFPLSKRSRHAETGAASSPTGWDVCVSLTLMEFWHRSDSIILNNQSWNYGTMAGILDGEISCDKCSTRVKKLQALELGQTSVHVARTHSSPAPILLGNANLSEHLLPSTGVSSSPPPCSCFSSTPLSSAPHHPPTEIPPTFFSEPARFLKSEPSHIKALTTAK